MIRLLNFDKKGNESVIAQKKNVHKMYLIVRKKNGLKCR